MDLWDTNRDWGWTTIGRWRSSELGFCLRVQLFKHFVDRIFGIMRTASLMSHRFTLLSVLEITDEIFGHIRDRSETGAIRARLCAHSALKLIPVYPTRSALGMSRLLSNGKR